MNPFCTKRLLILFFGTSLLTAASSFSESEPYTGTAQGDDLGKCTVQLFNQMIQHEIQNNHQSTLTHLVITSIDQPTKEDRHYKYHFSAHIPQTSKSYEGSIEVQYKNQGKKIECKLATRCNTNYNFASFQLFEVIGPLKVTNNTLYYTYPDCVIIQPAGRAIY